MRQLIPLSIPNFEGNEKKYVNEAVEQGWVSTGGAYITKLEEMLSDYLKVPKVAACQSGTAAIHLALMECGVCPGDMVIVPTLTFIAAVNPIRYQFAEPVFMDCDESLCIDPIKIRKFCEEECEVCDGKLLYRNTGKRIKAIIVVHVFGNLADMEEIMDIAETFHLQVIEDATEALGSYFEKGRFAGKYAGTIGDFGAFSFNGNKIITTGGGGAVTARRAEAVEHMQYISTQAKDDPHHYVHNEIGYNYRMTNLQAALGVAQMEKLETFIERKRRNFDLYRELFKEITMGKLLRFREDTRSNQWFYSFEIETGDKEELLADIMKDLETRGIQTRTIWGLIHEQLPYRSAVSYAIEKASFYSRRILNLPASTQITNEEIHYVAEQMRDLQNSWSSKLPY